MENEKLILSTCRKLKTNFYIWLSGVVLLGVFCFVMNFSFSKLNGTPAINLQQLLVLCLFGGIPGILVWSKNKMKTLAEISNIVDRLNLYKKYFRIRQSVFFFLAFFIIFIFVFTGMENALMLFLVVLCLCMFIVPTRNRLETEAHLTEPETEIEPDLEIEPDPETESEPKSESE